MQPPGVLRGDDVGVLEGVPERGGRIEPVADRGRREHDPADAVGGDEAGAQSRVVRDGAVAPDWGAVIVGWRIGVAIHPLIVTDRQARGPPTLGA